MSYEVVFDSSNNLIHCQNYQNDLTLLFVPLHGVSIQCYHHHHHVSQFHEQRERTV
jgi:hypothetical protein